MHMAATIILLLYRSCCKTLIRISQYVQVGVRHLSQSYSQKVEKYLTSSICYLFELLDVEKYRDLEI